MRLECTKCLNERKVYKSENAEVVFEAVYRYAILSFDEGEEPELDKEGNVDDLYFSDDSELGDYSFEDWKVVKCDDDDLKEKINEIIEENGFVESELEELGLEYSDGGFSIFSSDPFKATWIE